MTHCRPKGGRKWPAGSNYLIEPPLPISRWRASADHHAVLAREPHLFPPQKLYCGRAERQVRSDGRAVRGAS